MNIINRNEDALGNLMRRHGRKRGNRVEIRELLAPVEARYLQYVESRMSKRGLPNRCTFSISPRIEQELINDLEDQRMGLHHALYESVHEIVVRNNFHLVDELQVFIEERPGLDDVSWSFRLEKIEHILGDATNDSPSLERPHLLLPSGERKQINHPSLHIGRHKQNSLLVPDSYSSVSRMHAELYAVNGVWWIRDCGSQFGTALNGVTLEQPVRVFGNSIITLANVYEFAFQIGGQTEVE